MQRLALFLAFAAAVPALCGDWNPKLAAQYLDSRQKEWAAWKTAAAATGGTCFSCHTQMTYMLARPGLRRVLGESQPTPYETALRDGLQARVSNREAKDEHAAQGLGVETVFAAMFLGQGEAFDRLWALQLREGQNKGAWHWFSLKLDPWEMPESAFYGAAVAALATGNAPAEYRQKPEVRERVAELTAYLRSEQPTQPLHNRLMLLWASSKMPDVLPEPDRKRLVKDLLAKQEPDGGWTLASLGPWTEHAKAPESSGSNAYATGFATFTLLKSGAYNPKIEKALDWLRAHQDAEAGYWDAKSMNKHFEPGSMQDQFMRDAATGFATLALLEAGETRGR